MRVSEHLDQTPPRPRVQLIESLARPAVVVEIRGSEFGPVYALSAEDPAHLNVIIEALTAASVSLEYAQAQQAETEGATWNAVREAVA